MGNEDYESVFDLNNRSTLDSIFATNGAIIGAKWRDGRPVYALTSYAAVKALKFVKCETAPARA